MYNECCSNEGRLKRTLVYIENFSHIRFVLLLCTIRELVQWVTDVFYCKRRIGIGIWLDKLIHQF